MAENGGIPYIGSTISLVSKSEIRYEGVLYTIDMQESTIALQGGAFGSADLPDQPHQLPGITMLVAPGSSSVVQHTKNELA